MAMEGSLPTNGGRGELNSWKPMATTIRTWFENGNAKHYEKAFRFDPSQAGELSPLLWVTPHSAPALMVHGDKDTGVPIWHSEKMLAEHKKNNVPSDLLVIKGVGHGFDIGFEGFAQYTPEQMRIPFSSWTDGTPGLSPRGGSARRGTGARWRVLPPSRAIMHGMPPLGTSAR
jgi:acetyl esterase/lipase